MPSYVPQSLGEWVVLFIVFTLGTVGKQIVDGLIALATGKQAEERTLLAQYRDDSEASRREADAMRAQRDAADGHRRQIAEHSSNLRYMLLSMGVPPTQIPPFPSRQAPAPPGYQSSASSIIEPPRPKEQ